MFKKIVSSWVFWVAVLIAILGAFSLWVPILGIPIAALTVLSAVLQGYENQKTQEDIDMKHTQATDQIKKTQANISEKHKEAMEEIAQAKRDAANQHTKALSEINSAKAEAARQYAEAEQKIKKARDEAHAENLLLNAEKFATSLMEKIEIVNEAIVLYPDFKQREYRQLGLEMSAAVIGNVDYIKWQNMRRVGYFFDTQNIETPLEEGEIAFFTNHAISYLTETVLDPANSDPQGLLYLACMYGYGHSFDEIDKDTREGKTN